MQSLSQVTPKMAPTNAYTPSVDCARIFTEVPPCNFDDSIMELPFLLPPILLKRNYIGPLIMPSVSKVRMAD